MFYAKALLAIFILAAADALSDNIFMHFGIPIVSEDIIFTLGSILAIHCWFRVKLGVRMGDSFVHLSFLKYIGSIMTTLLCCLLGMGFIYYGFKFPFTLMEGYRGRGHGYSMAAFGVATLLFSMTLLYFTVAKRWHTKNKKVS
ncbi:MAG: hypothetical protein HWE24_10565 [Oceanospirillaceae bacterium]|nr:hypothetical protein [Oceanospirillaceae bacterium]